MQADRKRSHDQSSRTAASESTALEVPQVPPLQHPAKRKRHPRVDDDIDELFSASFGKKVKKAALGSELEPTPIGSKSGGSAEDRRAPKYKDGELDRVLGAIRAAPKDEKPHRRGKHY
jgi:nucleolar protein 9